MYQPLRWSLVWYILKRPNVLVLTGLVKIVKFDSIVTKSKSFVKNEKFPISGVARNNI